MDDNPRSPTIGIVMLDTRFPRIPGDIGNPATFSFPVRYHRVPTASADRVVRRGARDLLPAFIQGARTLERDGVRAITTSCGFLARYQRELASAVSVPMFTSSLMLVPLVFRMLPANKAVGILTIDSASLSRTELVGAGVLSDMPVVVAGMETAEDFHRAILEDRTTFDVARARTEHVRVASRLMVDHPNVGAIVLECTNMPPYRSDIQRATGVPVFDIVHLVTLVRQALLL